MKRGTENLLKFKHLMRDLDLTESFALGVLQNLWLKTDINAPRGNIGKFTNEDIAVMIDWRGDPEDLVSALLSRGWLDEHEEHRLIVHDWPEHCEDNTHGKVARSMKYFADGAMPKLVNLGRRSEEVNEFYRRNSNRLENQVPELKPLKEPSSVTRIAQQNGPPVDCTDTDTDTDTDTEALADTEAEVRPEGSSVSDRSVSQSVSDRPVTVERILAATGEPDWYASYWRAMAERLKTAGETAVMADALRRIESEDGIETPGAFLNAKCRDALKRHGKSTPRKPQPPRKELNHATQTS